MWSMYNPTLIENLESMCNLNAKFQISGLYQLAVKEENLRCIIVLYLYIPFPSWGRIRAFPWIDSIMNGLISCDVIGFQAEIYSVHFLECSKARFRDAVSPHPYALRLHNADYIIRLFVLPTATPFYDINDTALMADSVLPPADKVQTIVSVCCLDQTKGPLHRVAAYAKLLDLFPQYLQKVQLLMILIPSKACCSQNTILKAELLMNITKLNGRLSRVNWVPVHFFDDSSPLSQLAGIYRDASVMLVTSLSEAVSMEAKHFVACQFNFTGVLVLSEFVGVSENMPGALLINPYAIDLTAKTLHRALSMPANERMNRMHELRMQEALMTPSWWANSLLDAVTHPVTEL